jgi:uncharacterized protein with HEPN domain
MTRSDLERLHDARSYAQNAFYHSVGLPADVLAGALQPQRATLYALVVVGEALGKISPALRDAAPAIQWSAINATRNRIVHAYWQVDLEVIADVVNNRINPPIAELTELIELVEHADE